MHWTNQKLKWNKQNNSFLNNNKKKVGCCSRQTNLSGESVLCLQHVRHTHTHTPHLLFYKAVATHWKIKGWVSFSCKFEGMLHVHVPAGSRPGALTFLSPEKNNSVRSYRSCLARDRREGRGKRKGWADISLSMRTIWTLQLLICMPDPVKLKIL